MSSLAWKSVFVSNFAVSCQVRRSCKSCSRNGPPSEQIWILHCVTFGNLILYHWISVESCAINLKSSDPCWRLTAESSLWSKKGVPSKGNRLRGLERQSSSRFGQGVVLKWWNENSLFLCCRANVEYFFLWCRFLRRPSVASITRPISMHQLQCLGICMLTQIRTQVFTKESIRLKACRILRLISKIDFSVLESACLQKCAHRYTRVISPHSMEDLVTNYDELRLGLVLYKRGAALYVAVTPPRGTCIICSICLSLCREYFGEDGSIMIIKILRKVKTL